MTDTHETIADIMRKIRNEIAELRKVSPNVPSIAADWWEARADEIEAAHKREAGDAAKLREALEKIAHYDDDDANMDDPYCADGRICADIARQALAAPPRNCDIYLTEEAVDAAAATVRDCWACSRIDMEAPCVFCMVRWLLAPAKEGGRNVK